MSRKPLVWWLAFVALLWMVLALVLVVSDFGGASESLDWKARWYLIFTVLLSLTAMGMYGFDKHRAKREGRRVRERTLQLVAFFGGWPGALVGQQLFRHKTQKKPFQTLFWSIVIVHVVLIFWWLFLQGPAGGNGGG